MAGEQYARRYTRIYKLSMLDKPVIVYPGFEDATDPPCAQRYRFMRKGAYPAGSTADIRRYIRSGKWKESNPARVKVAGVCCDNFGNATGKVVQIIRGNLDEIIKSRTHRF